MVARNAKNGGLLFFVLDGRDAAVALVNPRISSLLVLCVAPELRGQGVGRQAMEYLRPNFVRALESAVPYFERLGYVGFGAWKMGRSLRTRIMVRDEIRRLSGRLRQLESHPDKRAGLGSVAPEHLGAALL
jgi:GNAT superfamily N-acetyltransferase